MTASVLIVGFHTYPELERCLTSLDRHEPTAEVIVVDHDADADQGSALTAAHPRVKYEARTENRGFGAGINRAARLATGTLFIVLNPDVELRAPIVELLHSCFAAHPRVGIAGGLVRETDGSVQPSARRFPELSTAFGGRTSWLTRVIPGNPLTRRNLAATDVRAGAAEVDWVTGAFMAIRREVFESLGGFDERFFMYWEDSDLCLRALHAGWKTLYEPGVEVVHATGRASRHAPMRSLIAFHRSVFHHYWKHGSWLARLAAPLVAAGLLGRFTLRLIGRRKEAPAENG